MVRVLLLHGLAGKPAVWDPLIALLPEGVEVTNVEQPWHGMSDGTWAHDPDPVRLVVDAVRPEHDVVVAHSFGATLLAEAYATGRVPARPSVLLCPFHRSSVGEFDWPTITYYLNDFHRTFEEAMRVGETARFPEKRRAWLARALRDQVGPYGWMRWFETYLRSPLLDFAEVEAPQLVLSGVHDVAARPEDGRALAKSLPHGRFELLDDCGHFPMLEQPARVAALVHDFLDDAWS
jgi:pimeloyl-ACP methyl ester carboxylesterase